MIFNCSLEIFWRTLIRLRNLRQFNIIREKNISSIYSIRYVDILRGLLFYNILGLREKFSRKG